MKNTIYTEFNNFENASWIEAKVSYSEDTNIKKSVNDIKIRLLNLYQGYTSEYSLENKAFFEIVEQGQRVKKQAKRFLEQKVPYFFIEEYINSIFLPENLKVRIILRKIGDYYLMIEFYEYKEDSEDSLLLEIEYSDFLKLVQEIEDIKGAYVPSYKKRKI